jgi:16S rRNA (guanine527-N7)-methyltransferase
MNIEAIISEGLNKQGHQLEQSVIKKLCQMLDILNEWNARHNLTRITKPADQCIYLVLDATAALSAFDEAKVVLDVGTGAGFPGVVLAICLPDIKFYLNDVNAKKMAYLRHLKSRMDLDNIILEHQDVRQLDLEVDIITARAVAQPDELLKLTAHLKATRYCLYVSAQTAQLYPSVIELDVPGATRQTFLLTLLKPNC